MMRRSNTSVKTLVAAFVAATFGVSAGAAFAQTTTSHNARDEAAADSTGASHVTLTRQQSEQALHYSAARNLRICNLSGQAPSATESITEAEQRSPETRQNLAVVGPRTQTNPVTLHVSYAGNSEQIEPGNCFDFQAQNVRLSTAQRLPVGSVLDVSVAQMSGNRLASDRQSVRELKDQLNRQDEQVEQANAELSQAREKLAQTTRDLNQAESQERHVASAEHQTTQGERQEQQTAQEAQNSGRASNAGGA